jgi:hypothetical protein
MADNEVTVRKGDRTLVIPMIHAPAVGEKMVVAGEDGWLVTMVSYTLPYRIASSPAQDTREVA